MLKRRWKDGDWANGRVSPPTTITGTTIFPMHEGAVGSLEDAAPSVLRCVLCSFSSTAAEIVTASFGIVMRRDSFASLLCIVIH